MRLDKWSKTRTVSDVLSDARKHNDYVLCWHSAVGWLVAHAKRDKKATSALFTKHTTSSGYTWREQSDRCLDYGWSITMTPDRYNPDKNSLNIYITNADGTFIKGYEYHYSYEKGATWQDVIDAIYRYAPPKKWDITEETAVRYHTALTNIIKSIQEIEEQADKDEKTVGTNLLWRFVEDN